jgi:hypothetical protein
MNEDQFDEILSEAARDYNAPPPGDVPRDAMWARIVEARKQRTVAVPKRSARVWLWPSVGIAAALLIATGIGIGRRMERSSPLGGGTAASRDTNNHRDTTTSTPVPREVAAAPRESSVSGAREATREAPGPDRTLAYQLVVLQHLAGTEAMITSFRAAARSGETDAHVGKWARELLGTTRLLEASPASDDPVMKRLLEDLELVIVQIVQYTTRGTNDPEELDLIEQSIKKRGVITKLRSTLPAEPGLAGIRG